MQAFVVDQKRSVLKELQLHPFTNLCLFRRPGKADLVSVACSFAGAKHKHIPPNEAAQLMHGPPLQTINIVLFISWTPRLQPTCIFHCDNP